MALHHRDNRHTNHPTEMVARLYTIPSNPCRTRVVVPNSTPSTTESTRVSMAAGTTQRYNNYQRSSSSSSSTHVDLSLSLCVWWIGGSTLGYGTGILPGRVYATDLSRGRPRPKPPTVRDTTGHSLGRVESPPSSK